jgi:polysaccharide export outer membrane protein
LGKLIHVLGRPSQGGANSRKHWIRIVLLGLLLPSLLLAQQAPPPVAPIVSSTGSRTDSVGEYVIGPQDLLSISILESSELSREVRVAGDGTIGLPLLAERVRVLGLTLSQTEELLRQKYQEGGILNEPNITVSLKELQSKPVTVSGAVRNPGVFQVSGQVRLLRILSLAGGVGEDAGSAIQILRGVETDKPAIELVRVQDLMEGKPEANVLVRGGDTVNVLPAGAVYVIGAVNQPGRHLLRGETQQSTILNVLALAQDLKRTAKPDKAVLIRKTGTNGAVEQIPVDIRKILERKIADVAVMPNDVLYVPDSAAKRAFTRGLEAAIQLATGAVLFGVR